MLIVEGLDGSGKTTLINNLLNHGGQLLKPLNIDNSLQKYQLLLNKSSDKSIMDRCFISEMVYGKVLTNRTKLTEQEYYELLNLYSKYNSNIVYLYAPKSILLKRRNNDVKDKFVLSKYYEELLNEFQKRLDQANNFLPVFKINTYENNQQEATLKVKKLTKF